MKKIVVALTAAGLVALGLWLGNRSTEEHAAPRSERSSSLAEGGESRPSRDSLEVHAAPTHESAARPAPETAAPSPPRASDEWADSESGEGRVRSVEQLRRLRREARTADRLEAEDPLLNGRSLSLPAIQELQMASPEEFDAVLDRLESEGMSDPLALELTEAYERFMNQGLDGEHGDFQMDRLACGLRTCIGESFADPALWDAALAHWQEGYGPPLYAISEWPIQGPGGTTMGHRIIFSTDPENNSISIPISYRPPDSSNPPPESDTDG